MRWITILNLIPSKDGTNLRFQISNFRFLAEVGKILLRAKIFLHFFGQRLGFDGIGVI